MSSIAKTQTLGLEDLVFKFFHSFIHSGVAAILIKYPGYLINYGIRLRDPRGQGPQQQS